MIVPSHFVPLAAPGVVIRALGWMANPESPFYVKPRLDRDLVAWSWRFNRAATTKRAARAAPVLRDLHLASRNLFDELAYELRVELVTRGILMVCHSERGLEAEARTAEEATRLGIPAQVVTRAQLADLEPDVRMRAEGGVLYPKDAHLDPARFMSAIARAAERHGVILRWSHRLTGWRQTQDRIDAVTTSQGELQADEFVVCAGSWSPTVLGELEVALPLQPGKGYSLTLAHPSRKPTRGMILSEAHVAVTPMGDTLRFGGTMELAGLDESIHPPRIRGIIKSVQQYLPDFRSDELEGIRPWCGLRPCSPDGLPYVGRLASYGNLSVATGHAMLGLSLGPITGKLMSEVLSDDEPSMPIELLSPDRYARRR
jgi:D-amino-acid dehydrogenase